MESFLARLYHQQLNWAKQDCYDIPISESPQAPSISQKTMNESEPVDQFTNDRRTQRIIRVCSRLFTSSFIAEVLEELDHKIRMQETGIAPLSKTEQFAYHLLKSDGWVPLAREGNLSYEQQAISLHS